MRQEAENSSPYAPVNNLFAYATKELSQDAFICWLCAQSGNESDDVARKASQALLHAFLSDDDADKPIKVLEIRKQFLRIDVALFVEDGRGERHWIIVEDKTDGTESKDQLEKYRKALKKAVDNREIADAEICRVYYKSGYATRWELQRIGKDVVVVTRPTMIELLEGAFRSADGVTADTSGILKDYYRKLKDEEDVLGRYKENPIYEWAPSDFLEYFAKELCKALEGLGCDVFWLGRNDNPNGGRYSISCDDKEHTPKGGFRYQLNLETANFNQWDSCEWKCRLLVRWENYDHDPENKNRKDLKRSLNPRDLCPSDKIPAGAEPLTNHPGKYAIICQMFAVPNISDPNCDWNHETLTRRVLAALDQYLAWKREGDDSQC